MKIFTITLFLLLLNIQQAKGFIPEITFLIDDNFYDYTIVVERLSVNDPLFGENFMEVNSSLYDYVTCSEFDFEQIYPNPFNPGTIIRYQIPNDGLVTLKVYDILGSEVATLVNEQKTTGRYEVNFNATSLASGVYIYKLQAGDYVSSKKMMLIK